MITKEETQRTPFTGTERMGAVINPGSTSQEYGRLIIRNMVQEAQDQVSDPRLSGDLTIEVNAWFDASTLSGPMWGTFVLKNDGGKWLCAWIGHRTAEGFSAIDAWGCGVDAYDGLMAHWNYARQSPDPTAPFSVVGYIVTRTEAHRQAASSPIAC